MESLALLVGLMMLFVLILGPLTWILSKIIYIPTFFIWILGVLSIIVGLYWFFLPVNFLRFIGLFTAYLGYISIQNKNVRKIN